MNEKEKKFMDYIIENLRVCDYAFIKNLDLNLLDDDGLKRMIAFFESNYNFKKAFDKHNKSKDNELLISELNEVIEEIKNEKIKNK